MRTLGGALVFVVFLLTALSSTPAEEFYSGKKIRFIVGFAAGGGYDAYLGWSHATSVATFPASFNGCRKHGRGWQRDRRQLHLQQG